MSRSRPNTLQKTEKENENKNIKRKLRIVAPKAEGVERTGTLLDKRRPISPRKGRLGSHVYPRQSTPEPESLMKTVGILTHHKPFSPYMNPTGSKTRLSSKPGKSSLKVKSLSPIKDTKLEEESAITGSTTHTGSVLELYTPRNGLSLKESSSDNKCKGNLHFSPRKPTSQKKYMLTRSPRLDIPSLSSGSSTYLNLELDICSLGSPESKTDVFHTAPLLTVPTAPPSLESSATLIRKFRHVLEQQRKFMPDDEIKVIKEVLKTDDRITLLKAKEPDPNLFSDILKTQLQGIVHHERVVKTALQKLGSVTRQELAEEAELCDLQKMRSMQKNIASERNIAHKRKRKMNFSPDIVMHSDDNSFKQKPGFGFQEMSLFHEQCDFMDIHSSAGPEKPNDFSEKLVNLKRCGNPFEDFVKSTLPLKRKVTSAKISQTSFSRDVPRNDFDVNIVRNELGERRERRRSKSARKPQVDVTFKNVPTLEKEILILKALGERLEATLKRTLSEPSLSDLYDKKQICTQSSMSSLTKELQKIDSSIQVYAGRRTPVCPMARMMDVVLWRQAKVGLQIFSKGLRHEVGVIYEFIIVSKTIDELKSDAESNFYVPMINKSGVLERTSFKQLTEEPNEFIRHLKPKNNNLAFNVLDHDPLFFNSFVLPNLKSVNSDKIKPESNLFNASKGKSKETIVIFEGGDSSTRASEGLTHIYTRSDSISSVELPIVPILKKKTITTKTTATNTNTSASARARTSTSKNTNIYTNTEHVEKLTEKFQASKPQSLSLSQNQLPSTAERNLDTQIRRVQRNRIKRTITPMPFDAYDEPKNNLLKTILVGTVQITIFLVLIMAITYPDIKC